MAHVIAIIMGLAVLLIMAVGVGKAALENTGVEDMPNAGDGMEIDKLYGYCLSVCEDAGYTLENMAECDIVPDGTESDCGYILTMPATDDSDYDGDYQYNTPKVPENTFSLDGEFEPCSVMTVRFSSNFDAIDDFGIKIADSSDNAITLRYATNDNEIEKNDGIYILCKSGMPCEAKDENSQVYTSFRLPCDYADDIEKFNPDTDYTISFHTVIEDLQASLDSEKKHWSCQNHLTYDTLNLNQIDGSNNPTSIGFKTTFTKDGTAIDTKVFVTIDSVTRCMAGENHDIDTDNPCQFDPSNYNGVTSEGESQYQFIMPEIVDGSDKKFNIFFRRDIKSLNGNYYPLCASPISNIYLACKNPKSVICAMDDDDSEEDGEYMGPYILSSQSDDGEHTIDGLCFYDNRYDFEVGCVDIETKEIVEESESDCDLPQYVFRSGDHQSKLIVDGGPACVDADFEIVDIYPCKDGSCDKDTSLNRMDDFAQTSIIVEVKNTGNVELPISVDPYDFLDIEIDGNGETAFSMNPTKDSLAIDGIVKIECSINTMKDGSHLLEGSYAVTARLKNIDTALYPLIDESARESNNQKTVNIEVISQFCADCSSKLTQSDCEDCSDQCKWVFDGKSSYLCKPR